MRSFAMKRLIPFALYSLAIAACATTTGGAPIRGKTAADAKLAADTYRKFSAVAAAELKCNTIEYAEVKDSRTAGKVLNETWIAHGCGRSAPFNVTFSPTLHGDYISTVARKK